MSDYSLIQEKKRLGSLVGYWDFLSGSFLDLSSNANNGTPSNVEFGGHRALLFGSAGRVVVSDSSELQGDTWTLVVFGELNKQSATGRLIYKRDAGGTQYDWQITATGFQLEDGANTRTIALSATDSICNAVSFTDGGTPVHYQNGLPQGNYSGTVAIAVDNADIVLGNDHNFTSPCPDSVRGFMIFNEQLTATEHAQLYGELMS